MLRVVSSSSTITMMVVVVVVAVVAVVAMAAAVALVRGRRGAPRHRAASDRGIAVALARRGGIA